MLWSGTRLLALAGGRRRGHTARQISKRRSLCYSRQTARADGPERIRMMRSINLTLFLLVVSTGCERSDADKLARVGRKVANKVEMLVPNKTPFGSSIPLAKGGVDERVYE